MPRMAILQPGEIVVDSFAGGGGASLGIHMALGRGPDIAINHDVDAIKMHEQNHPESLHMTEDVWKVNPKDATGGRPVGLLWASPDCRHFSRAKGGKPVEKSIRSLAWVVVKWAAEVRPRIIILENVREFAEWGPIVPAWRCTSCKWRGTEGQARLVRTRRRCPQCDHHKLIATEEFIPDPDRKGLTFKRWAGRLRNLGYQVEWRNLNAADFGAPTHRRRLFLIARCDGLPIVWPDVTHGDPKKIDSMPLLDPLQPWRTAAECIDWDLPCPSIFERKRPLADATLRRIALGIKRYVLDNPKPFIVRQFGKSTTSDIDSPMPTTTSGGGGKSIVATPILAQLAHGDYKDGSGGIRSNSTQSPLGVVQAGGNNHALVAAFFAKHFGGVVGHDANRPLGTVTSVDHHSAVAVHLTKFRGDSTGQDIAAPMPTVTSGAGSARPAGAPHALAVTAANLIHLNHGGKQDASVNDPLRTVMSKGLHAALVASSLIRMNHGESPANAVDEPLRTVTSQANKFGLIYSFLVRYFGTAIGQYATEPLFTITGKDRFGVVTVQIEGEPYILADIGMRMLTPRELARAQGFSNDYILTGTKTSQVARIGNSVCPVMAKVLVEANLSYEMAGAA